MDYEKVIEKEVEELKDRDDVRAIAVTGSYTRHPEEEHKDIDLYIIVEGEWRKRESEVVDDVVVERFFNSVCWTEKYFDDKEDFWYIYRWFKDADIRYDPEGVFEEMQELAEEKKQKISEFPEEEKGELLYSIWDMKKDLETDDVGQKRYMMYHLFDYLLHKQYKLKGEIPDQPNYIIRKLKEVDGYMYKLAQDFFTSSSTMEKERKLEKMIDHVTRNLGEPTPELETNKEEMEEEAES